MARKIWRPERPLRPPVFQGHARLQVAHRFSRTKGFRASRAFSKRRQAIEEAGRAHGYKTAKGMERARLRTRRAKRDMRLEELFKIWEARPRRWGSN